MTPDGQALKRNAYRRGGPDTAVLFDSDFLTEAHEPAVMRAILRAALTGASADSCDLQLHDSERKALRIRAQHGFTPAFLGAFGVIPTSERTACTTALLVRRPVLVDNVGRSPIFAGEPTLAPMLEAGSRAVASYPLSATDGRIFGVLSFHYRRPGLGHGAPALVALGAATALSHLPTNGDGSGPCLHLTP